MSAVELSDSVYVAAEPRPTFDPYATDHRPLYDALKRGLDIIIAVAVLGFFIPAWLVIAAAIRFSSAGPIFHRGTVIGRRGRPFTWFKFRTMVVAGDHAHRDWLRDFVLADQPYQGGLYKLTPDPRVTAVGAVLRRFSLDEIPQFINVLRGEMSVVGPRPPIEFEFSLYDDFRCRRLAVRPGITGLHQVTGRSRVPFSMMLASDIEYINRRSVWFDLSIMVRTVAVMISGSGAA